MQDAHYLYVANKVNSHVDRTMGAY